MQSRLFFLDILKAISIVAVVSYHSVFIPRSSYSDSFFWVEALSVPLRFCVPLLLIISFLLTQKSLDKKPNTLGWDFLKKRLSRLAIPTFFWFGVAALLKLIRHKPPMEILQEMIRGEIFTGAYYLLILFQLTLIFVWFRRFLKHPNNLAIILLLQCFVFIGIFVTLANSPNNLAISVLRSLDRPFILYWFGYIALGVLCYQKLPRIIHLSSQINLYFKSLLLLIIALLSIAEYSWIARLTQNSIPPFDYVMISCLLSAPALLICFATIDEQQLPVWIKAIVKTLSKYSLGIFCINGILSQIFLSFGSKWAEGQVFSLPEVLALKVVGWILLLGISLGISIELSRCGLKTVVS